MDGTDSTHIVTATSTAIARHQVPLGNAAGNDDRNMSLATTPQSINDARIGIT